MMASAIERSDSEELRKKLDAKELRAGDYQENDAESEENDSMDEENPETTDEEMESEFWDGAEYLQWLDCQLPYLQPFESPYAVHQYFFRYWTRDEQYQFLPEMEPLVEMDEDLDEVDEYVEYEADEDEIWEEGLKPDFKSGRQLVEWLERKMPYLEPFAPDDAIHYCFNREWSKVKFQPSLDVLVEEHMEDILRQDAAPHNHVPKENMEEEIENSNPYIRMMASPKILDGVLLQKMALQKDEIRTASNEHLGENSMNEVEPPNDTLLGDTSKMVLQKAEVHVRTESDRQREDPMNEFEPPVDDTLHGDTPSNALRITEIWSRFKCLANKKTKMGKKRTKKEKRNKMSVLSRLFGR